MKKKTKKAAKPHPKTYTETHMAWNSKRVVVRRVTGTALEVNRSLADLIREVCPNSTECWQVLSANAVVEVRR